jgi:hypothetical protein
MKDWEEEEEGCERRWSKGEEWCGSWGGVGGGGLAQCDIFYCKELYCTTL